MYLTGYQEASRKHLLTGFLHGFRWHFQGLKRAHFPTILFQHLSTDIVDQKLAKEIPAGRIIGPFEKPLKASQSVSFGSYSQKRAR